MIELELIKQINNLQRQVDGLVKPEVPLGMSLISETVLSIAAASVTFSSIPQGFRHLMIMANTRTDAVSELDTLIFRFNADSGGNYDYSQIQNGAFGTSRGVTFIVSGLIEAANSRANSYTFSQTYISSYARTDIEKYNYSYGGAFGNVSAAADLFYFTAYGRWRSIAAITSITYLPIAGLNFVSGSRFQLYGLM